MRRSIRNYRESCGERAANLRQRGPAEAEPERCCWQLLPCPFYVTGQHDLQSTVFTPCRNRSIPLVHQCSIATLIGMSIGLTIEMC